MKYLKLNQFRCFEQFEIQFKKGINVLIGDNSNGKTSLLMACKYALSTFFIGFSDLHTRLISPTTVDFRININKEGIRIPLKPIIISFSEIYSNLENKVYSVQKNSVKNSKLSISGMKEFKSATKFLLDNLYNGESRRQILPVFACFSTEDIHSKRKIDSKLFSNINPMASFGYYECFEAKGFFDYWKKRMLILQEANVSIGELDIVKRAILDVFNGIIDKIEIRVNAKEVLFYFCDGRIIEAERLSDGYKRLMNIVIDIAFRSALLNREVLGVDAAKKSFGTVLIDEIDMHLHPSLQSSVLQRLKKTFSNIQFIVTTHSPMVMANLRSSDEDVIYKLAYNNVNDKYEIEEVSAYGRDISSVVDVVLGILPRNKETDDKLRELFDLIDQDKISEAKCVLSKLKEEYTDSLPEFIKAETMINFLSDEED